MRKPQEYTVIILPKRAGPSPALPPVAAVTPTYKPSKQDPLAVAAMYVRDFDKDAMTYRGRPIHLNDIMRMANRALVASGEPQITYNEAWRV